MWNVQSGTKTNLVKILNKKTEEFNENQLIGFHLTRTKQEKRDYFIDKLKLLTRKPSTFYMLNSGQLALAYVANGNLSGFINNYTNTWDVAAGEVLVRAMGGKVTDFSGKSIDYGKETKVEVVAASNESIHNEIINSIKEGD
jgi:fructose-1,6-bisphosphatase/inositol monophosphatase family enzyme